MSHKILPKTMILLAVVTLFMSGPAYCSADEQSKDLSKEEPQLSAASGLVKRSAPASQHSSAAYGHSIMRFGRAPHNIMHFGKRAGGYQDSDSYDDGTALDSSAEQLTSVPDWILANYLKGGQQQQQQAAAPSNGKLITKYLLVPIQVPAGKVGGGPIAAQSKRAGPGRFSPDESDNVFMHFG